MSAPSFDARRSHLAARARLSHKKAAWPGPVLAGAPVVRLAPVVWFAPVVRLGRLFSGLPAARRGVAGSLRTYVATFSSVLGCCVIP